MAVLGAGDMTIAGVLVLVPAIAAFLVASFRFPLRIALPAYAVLVPFGQGISTGLPGAFGSVSSILGICLGIALLLQVVTGRRRGMARLPATVPVWLGYLALAGASVLWTVRPQATAVSFAVLASHVLLFALIAIVQVEHDEFVRIEDAILIGGVAVVAFGLLQLTVLGGLPSSPEGSPRFGNGLLGPNNQAAALLLPLVIALVRILTRSRGPRWLNTIAVALLLVGILMTGSRGGLLAVVVIVVALGILVPRGRAAMVGLGAAALIVIGLVLSFNPAGIGERQLNRGDSSSGRTEIWAVGLHACETYCLTGSGWGTFPAVYALERASVPEARVLRRGIEWEPHNIWMLVGIETGLAGLVVVALGLGLTVLSAARLPARLRAPPLVALLAIVFAGFFLSYFEYKLFWLVLIYAVLAQNRAVAEVHNDHGSRPIVSTRP